MHSDIELLHRMLSIPSPSTQEGELARFLADTAGRMGMSSTVDEAGNFVAETGTGDGPTVLLLGHMDTVDDPMPVTLEEDRIYGRGAVDAKGPLAAMLLAASRRPGFPGRLIVAGAVEEETPTSLGAMHLRQVMSRPDALLIGEPSGWSGVVLGYKGKLDVTYRVERAATHPTNPEEKASEAAMAFWSEALTMLGVSASHASFDQPAVTLYEMGGDLVQAWLEFSYRLPPGFDHDGLVEKLQAIAGDGQVSVRNSVLAARTSRTDPVVRALSSGIRQAGGTPRHVLKTATSDMNTVAEVWDMPMAAYGPGDSRLDHSAQEHILLDDFLRGIAVLGTALDELAVTLDNLVGQP